MESITSIPKGIITADVIPDLQLRVLLCAGWQETHQAFHLLPKFYHIPASSQGLLDNLPGYCIFTAEKLPLCQQGRTLTKCL